ncbi:tetratricopeptide repeat protein [Microcoleus sp. Pol14C6]|uniref:tetratricopeptide repeat protein n=1 Tax=unclassified Microcoleus TaxID=2642155 RepID=UPI002FD1CEC7
MGNRMDDCAHVETLLARAKNVLEKLEIKKAGYTVLNIPSDLEIELEAKHKEVADLEDRLAKAQLAKKETQQSAQSEMNRQSPMRSRVPDSHYIEREEAKRLLERFALALKESEGQPLLFNIWGTGGVGKTTLLGRLKDAHAGKVDFLEICFAKTPDIETPLKLMRKVHEQAVERFGGETIADSFKQKEQQFESTLYKLSHQSIEGETISSEEAKKITSWFQRFIWLRPKGLTSTSSKPTSFNVPGVGFSALAAIGEDADSLQESIEQRVRIHPATKDQPELQALMLQPVSKLTQAFAESLMQIAQSRGRSLVLILDTYEKAQSYLNQWLWQYLVEDTALSSAPVRLVVVGRRSLQADEGWRKLNQDRKLLLEVPLKNFSRKDTEEYLKQIGIEKGGIHAKIYKATQGLPYYLDWVRKQREQGEEPDFSKGNQAIAELLLQGIESRRKVLYVVACCRWFDRAMIQYLLGSVELGLQQDAENVEGYFEWLKRSDFVEFTEGHYRLDDVVRDVFRQSYFQDDQKLFRKTHALLANYFQQQADELVTSEMFLAEQYEEEEWRELMAEFLYYNLFGNGKEGLQKYIEQVFTAVYLQVPDVFMAPFAFICSEITEENQNLLSKATGKFFKDSGIALSFGWNFIYTPPTHYKIKFEGENPPSEQAIEEFAKQIKVSIQSLLGYVGDLKDSLGKCAGLIYKSLRCNTLSERTDSLLQAKIQCEKLTHCHPKLKHTLFSSLGDLLGSVERYKDSLDSYQKALELDQSNASTLVGQGVALGNLKRPEEALESFEKAIDLDSESVDAWVNRGKALLHLKRYEEALESLLKALDLAPKSVDAWVNRGAALRTLERYEEALESFQKALDLDTASVDAWVNRGNTLYNLERYEEALESYQKALDLDTESVDAWVNRGAILLDLERYEKALESCQKALDLAPKSVDALLNRGKTLNNLERYEEALKSFQTALDLAPESVDAWVNQGVSLYNLERYEEALESCEKALDLDPKYVDAWANQGSVLLHLERYEEVLTSCERAFKIDSENDQAMNNQALALSLLNNFEKAITAINEAINLKPQEVLYRANRGIILARAGRYTEALADCEQAIKQNPKHESGYYGKACCYALQGDIGKALDNLQKAIDIAPRRSRNEAKDNPDFDSIRDDERFRALM